MSKVRFEYTQRPANQDSSVLLGKTPPETREEYMYSNWELDVLGLFAQTSQQAEKETAFFRLIRAALYAMPQEAVYAMPQETLYRMMTLREQLYAIREFRKNKAGNTYNLASIAILKKYPELLIKKGTGKDAHGRVINQSAWVIFLSSGDVWAFKKAREEIYPLLSQADQDEADKQLREAFPNLPWPLPETLTEDMFYDDRNKKQIEAIEKQLAVIKQCIDVDPFSEGVPNDATKQAIVVLCKLFEPSGEVIRTGLHWPLAIPKKIYETYNKLQRGWSFFSLNVIKPALDASSTVDQQCYQFGLSVLDMKRGPSRRCHKAYQHPKGKPLSLTLVNGKDKRRPAAIVDPYDGGVLFSSTSSPGYFHCFNKIGGVGRLRMSHMLVTECLIRLLDFWTTYAEKKQRLFRDITQPIEEKSTHTSITMTNR